MVLDMWFDSTHEIGSIEEKPNEKTNLRMSAILETIKKKNPSARKSVKTNQK